MERVEAQPEQADGHHPHGPGPAASRNGRILMGMLVAVVALAPLPLGSTRPVAWLVLTMLVGLLLVAWSVLLLLRRLHLAVAPRRLLPVILPLLLALAWACLQGTGQLPAGLLHPLWEETWRTLDVPGPASLSLDPQATFDAVLRNAAYVGIFFLAVQLGRDPSNASMALSALAVAGAAYAIYGLFMHLSGMQMILWMPKWAYQGDLTATFVNRNAYGAYAGIGLLCCLARLTQAIASLHSGRSFRLRDLADRLAIRAVPMLVATFLLLTAVLLTHSRGAMISVLAGLAALLACFVAARLISRRKALLLVVVAIPLVLGLLLFSGEETLSRLSETSDHVSTEAEARTPVYRLVIGAIAQAPWTGYGLGAFLSAFRQFRDPGLPGPLVWDYAHNVHLELLMDLGIPGAALVYVAMAAMVILLVRGMRRRRRHQVYPAVALACLFMAGVHGAMDFSPQVPAVAATLSFVLGIGVAQSWSRRSRARDASPEESAVPSP